MIYCSWFCGWSLQGKVSLCFSLIAECAESCTKSYVELYMHWWWFNLLQPHHSFLVESCPWPFPFWWLQENTDTADFVIVDKATKEASSTDEQFNAGNWNGAAYIVCVCCRNSKNIDKLVPCIRKWVHALRWLSRVGYGMLLGPVTLRPKDLNLLWSCRDNCLNNWKLWYGIMGTCSLECISAGLSIAISKPQRPWF